MKACAALTPPLRQVMMDWLGQLVGVPERFLNVSCTALMAQEAA